MDIHIRYDIRRTIRRTIRSLALALVLLLALALMSSDSTYSGQLNFQRDCEAAGGFVTLTDMQPTCTRIRSGGMMQL